MSRSGSKRKSSETDTEDYDPGGASEVNGNRGQESTRRQQSSPYIGVTKYKRTGRYEAHVWNSKAVGLTTTGKRGRQLHLGSFTTGERAAKAYDMAALKLKGYDSANTNFNRHTYHTEPFMMENQHLDLEEFVRSLRQWAQLSPLEEERYNMRATETHKQHGELPQLLLLLQRGGSAEEGAHRANPEGHGQQTTIKELPDAAMAESGVSASGSDNGTTLVSNSNGGSCGADAISHARSQHDMASVARQSVSSAVKPGDKAPMHDEATAALMPTASPKAGLPPVESGAPGDSYQHSRFAQRDPRPGRFSYPGNAYRLGTANDGSCSPHGVHPGSRVVTPDVTAMKNLATGSRDSGGGQCSIPLHRSCTTEQAAASAAKAAVLAASKAFQGGVCSAGLMPMPQPDSSVQLAIHSSSVKDHLAGTLNACMDAASHGRMNACPAAVTARPVPAAFASPGGSPAATGDDSAETVAQEFMEMTRDKMQQFMLVWCQEKARETTKLQAELKLLESQLAIARREASSAAMQGRELAQILRSVALERDQLRAITTATRRALTAELPTHVPVPSRLGLN